MINKIFNEDCKITMEKLPESSIDLILTSPPYNTTRKGSTDKYHRGRYDEYVEGLTEETYANWIISLFSDFDKILKENGCILWNYSWSAESPITFFRTINKIDLETSFTVADWIIWKKNVALPNNMSPNKLTRITEPILVLCRKDEFKTFHCNKAIISRRKTGQANYENVPNFIEARNNDKPCKLNRATFSSDLVVSLLSLYAPENAIVYDPFMGTGTTAVGCVKYGCSYVGSEISSAQCEYAENRINEISLSLFK